MGLIKLTKEFSNNLLSMFRGSNNISYVITKELFRIKTKIPLPVPNVISTLDKFKIYINDLATLNINLPDHYERREYMRHSSYMPRKGWFVIDVGAYIGIYSLWVSKLVGDEGLVVAIEPNPIAYQWLVNNIRLNRINNVRTLPYAIGDELGKALLYVAQENIGASSLIENHLKYSRLTTMAIRTVPIITLDYFIDRAKSLIGMNINRVDLLKMDIEGYELRAIQGAKRMLKSGLIKKLIIETHLDYVSMKDVINYLTKFDYICDKVVHFGNVKSIIYLRHKTISLYAY
jgi:FkbM family methyltransferase